MRLSFGQRVAVLNSIKNLGKEKVANIHRPQIIKHVENDTGLKASPDTISGIIRDGLPGWVVKGSSKKETSNNRSAVILARAIIDLKKCVENLHTMLEVDTDVDFDKDFDAVSAVAYKKRLS